VGEERKKKFSPSQVLKRERETILGIREELKFSFVGKKKDPPPNPSQYLAGYFQAGENKRHVSCGASCGFSP
jgi:hypothetical protein